MTVAGRILIMPKGAWDATTEYEMLDLVRYNGTSWLAKKNSVGVAPTEGEYWQNMFDADAFIDAKIEAAVKAYMEKNA